MRRPTLPLLLLACVASACGERATPAASTPRRPPSILLVTLDTTRADSIGPHARTITTPSFNALATRGRLFRQAYATVPETLPSHTSMMTGMYPAAHGVHENARYVAAHTRLSAEQLQQRGYTTAAFVSSFVLSRRYGLARGFTLYDDELGEANERSSTDTTNRALSYLASAAGDQPLFLWVHYFDPHAPYSPPEPYRTKYPADPYRAEIAAMDTDLGRLVNAFTARAGADHLIIVAGDHGESLGEHGESQHGHLLYQGAMHVPLVIAGAGITPGQTLQPVSTRRIHHTLLDAAGIDNAHSLRIDEPEIVAGEAMKPFLQYGWQPQVMAIEGTQKAIFAGRAEVFDLASDPAEANDLGAGATLARGIRQTIRDYPVPSGVATAPPSLSTEEQKRLAALGYVSTGVQPSVRPDAPRPADMAGLLDELERASSLFVAGRHAEAIPLLERILARDKHNVATALRLAASYSATGRNDDALKLFETARAIAPPGSTDVDLYLALHLIRTGDAGRAAPLLERVLQQTPDRLPALEGLADVREKQGRFPEAVELWNRILTQRPARPTELRRIARMAMETGATDVAIRQFEQLRALDQTAFTNHLELGVLYLAARRLAEARDALDRVPQNHPGYPMALFKRAQVSVLLREPDAAQKIERARAHADQTTRPLIERERLFQ